jgi:hypothetical protein
MGVAAVAALAFGVPADPVALARVGDRQYLRFPRPGDEARFIDRLGPR